MVTLKRINPILALACTVLFFVHGLLSAFFISGRLSFGPVYKSSGRIFLLLLLAHAVIGIAMMTFNIKLRKKTHFGLYLRQNANYFGQRITGAALIAFSFLHIHAFGYTDAEGYHLAQFTGVSLFLLISLTLTAALHLLFSIKPMLISLKADVNSRGGRTAAVCLYLAILACAVIMVASGITYRSGFQGGAS